MKNQILSSAVRNEILEISNSTKKVQSKNSDKTNFYLSLFIVASVLIVTILTKLNIITLY